MPEMPLSLLTTPAPAADTEQEILDLFVAWNEALQSGDAQRVAALYAPDAVLLPTVSNRVRHNTAEIADYFAHFLTRAPYGRLIEANIRQVCEGVAVNSGVYLFTLSTPEGENVVSARFTFVYAKRHGEWRIVEHHSSLMPES
jgi:uncharacterized protein (TIGR02246 family)